MFSLCLCIACSDDQFQCKNTGRCIPGRWVCDNANNCGDWSDEQNCSEWWILALVYLHSSQLIDCFTDDQFLIAYLLQECVMFRDGLAKLPDCFTAGDMSDIASHISTCWLFPSLCLSLSLSGYSSLFVYICILCTISMITNKILTSNCSLKLHIE